MSIFNKNTVTHADVQHCHFDVEENINGLQNKHAVIFYALGVKPGTSSSPAVLGSLLDGNPKIFQDTFSNGCRFVLTEGEAKSLATGVMSYIECFANSIEEALLLINQRNQSRIKADKELLSGLCGMSVESIADEKVADKIIKHYLSNYKDLSIEGDSPTSDLPY